MSVNTKVNGQLVPSAGLYKVTTPIGMADIYSEDEREIGLWTDGKPLYQKTVHISSLPSSPYSQTTYYHNIADIDKICNWNGIATTPDGTTVAKFNIPHFDNTGFVQASSFTANVSKTVITIITGADRHTWTGDFTIHYTKTTDTPWSGKFVPQGYGYLSLADCYSLEEREVGCWTDGKPLYQKTIDLGSEGVQVPANGTAATTELSSGKDTLVWSTGISQSGKVFPHIGCSKGATYVQMENKTSNASNVRYFTYQYTKEHEYADDSTYVPNGSLAIHYSTNAQLIGTYVNSHKLYMKTLTLSSGTISDGVLDVGTTYIYGGKLIKCECSCTQVSNSRKCCLPLIRPTASESIYASAYVENNEIHAQILSDTDYELSDIEFTVYFAHAASV